MKIAPCWGGTMRTVEPSDTTTLRSKMDSELDLLVYAFGISIYTCSKRIGRQTHKFAFSPPINLQ